MASKRTCELYGIEVSPDLVSAATDSVIDEVTAWQGRPLDATYAGVFFDALRVKIRDEGLVRNKSVYLAVGTRVLRIRTRVALSHGAEHGGRGIDNAEASPFATLA